MASKSSLSLGKTLDISAVSGLQERMLKALEKADELELKANNVERVDTAGLQLVLCLRRELMQRGGDVAWKKPSDKIVETARLLGLDSVLGL